MWNSWLRKAVGWTILSSLGIAFVGGLALMMGPARTCAVLGAAFLLVGLLALGLFLIDA